MNLAGGAHARGDKRCQQAGGNRQARAFGNIVHLADDFDAVSGPAHQPGQQLRKRLRGAFHARRDDARSDHGRLEQAQVIAGEIEDFGDGGDFGGGLQIDARQAQNRLVDHPEVGFHRRLGRVPAGAAHAEIDGDVQHPRAFGKIHPQEEDVAPSAVRQVHAHGRGFAQNRKQRIGLPSRQQLRTDAQRIVGGMAGAEHPLVAAHGAHAAPHLVGQRLEAQRAICGGQRARDGRPRPARSLGRQEDVQRLLETALQQIGVSRERYQAAPRARIPHPRRNMKTMDGVEKEQGADALV